MEHITQAATTDPLGEPRTWNNGDWALWRDTDWQAHADGIIGRTWFSGPIKKIRLDQLGRPSTCLLSGTGLGDVPLNELIPAKPFEDAEPIDGWNEERIYDNVEQRWGYIPRIVETSREYGRGVLEQLRIDGAI